MDASSKADTVCGFKIGLDRQWIAISCKWRDLIDGAKYFRIVALKRPPHRKTIEQFWG